MQMVAISRALLGSPGHGAVRRTKSQGLAPKIVQDVLNTVRRLRDEGIAVLIVEQNALAALAERGTTNFEARGARLGHGVWDFLYRRRGG